MDGVTVLAGENPVQSLFTMMDELVKFEVYPDLMIPVPWRSGVIAGTSFFPGGYGFVKSPSEKLPEWPEGKVMVLGNDWGSECSFSEARKQRTEASASVWRGVFGLLPEVLHLPDCFFTNVFVGLRKGKVSSVGECPGRQDFDFKEACRTFLGEQIKTQRPRLILTLGKYGPDMLSGLAPALRRWAAETPTWKAIDEQGPLRSGVIFDVLPRHSVTVCALTHTDRPHLNYRHRNYGAHVNEVGLLKAALALSGLESHPP